MRSSGGFHGRRIQKTGGSTFIVSLPKNWVVTRGLGPGDVLFFTPRADGSLTIFPESTATAESERRLVEVSNDVDREHLFRRLIAEYIAGYPLLEVRTTGRMNARTREVVRSFAQRMIGPEILEETAESVILQDVVGANPLPIPSIIRREHQMVRAMQADAMAAFRERDLSIAKDVVERDWEVDRLHWFLEKQVTSALRDARILASLDLTLPECSTYLLASRVLERIADHAVRIAETVSILGKDAPPAKLVESLDRMAARAAAALVDALDSLDTRNIKKANEVIDAAKQLTRDRDQILRELASKKGALAVGLAYVLESLERAAFYASDLAEIAINRAVESPPRPEAPPARAARAGPGA
ncbi:MAG TPA: phosphate uptake regulator PhoU [Thermoplasmata archaeon]|nr:phosphate uptake regulator PhoU [Thermoplasmata archaeon]